jgi:hypothetical protein
MRETGVAIRRVENGKIAERWSDRDDPGLMRRLGVIQIPGD